MKFLLLLSLTIIFVASGAEGVKCQCCGNRAVTKFHFGPLVVNLDTSSMYFLCKILYSVVLGLMTKLLQSVKNFKLG